MPRKKPHKDTLETVNEMLEMGIEIKKLKKLLVEESKSKDMMAKEIDDLKRNLSGKPRLESSANINKKRIRPLLPYDHRLIDALRSAHQEIVFIYNAMMDYAESKKYEKVKESLDQFSNHIKGHYQYSDKELYCYLKCLIQQKFPRRERAYNELSLEMKNISLEIFLSISQSPNVPVNDRNHAEFIKEFTALGEKMNKRIDREENILFIMYEESNEVPESV